MGLKYVLLALVVLSCCCLVYPQCEGFADPPSDVTIQQGEGTTISCDHGAIIVDWYQGETEIDGDNQQESCSCVSEVIRGSTSINLTFTNITTANAGTYGCWTNNADGTFTKCNFEVVVTDMMLDDDVTENVTITPSKNLSVLLGDYISLNCSLVVPSSEDFTYTWTHLDSIIEEDSNILTLSSVSMEELGTYSCNISSPSSHGSAQVTITSARPVIDPGVYPTKITTSCSSLQQIREETATDVLQLLAYQYGVRPLGLSRSYSAESCDQVAEANPDSMSGLYWISDGEDSVQLQCNF